MREHDSENIGKIVHVTPNTAVKCFQTTAGETRHTISAMNDTQGDSYHT